jgi:hypothetical protein
MKKGKKRRNASSGVARPKAARKRRNASSGFIAPARSRGGGGGGGGGRGGNNNALKTIAAAAGGGALGAIAAGIAVGAGVKPNTAAIATLAGGAIGAYALKGNAKVAALGAACAASGQLALAWQVKRQAEVSAREEEKKRVALPAPSAAPALPAAPAPTATPAAPKRNGYEDDGSDDYRNAGEVEDYGGDDEYVQAA